MTYEHDRALMEGARNSACDDYFSARPQIDNTDRRRVYEAGFQAGAASRDAYIEQLELALLQVRKAICGDIHNTDDLFDLIASRDAEVAELQKAIDENWVTHQQIVAASKERDQLRDEIAELVAALKPFGAIDLVESRLPAEFAMLILRARSAIAKVRKPT